LIISDDDTAKQVTDNNAAWTAYYAAYYQQQQQQQLQAQQQTTAAVQQQQQQQQQSPYGAIIPRSTVTPQPCKSSKCATGLQIIKHSLLYILGKRCLTSLFPIGTYETIATSRVQTNRHL